MPLDGQVSSERTPLRELPVFADVRDPRPGPVVPRAFLPRPRTARRDGHDPTDDGAGREGHDGRETLRGKTPSGAMASGT